MGALTNQLAAMPSLHVGWAVWVAWVVAGLSTHRWVRILALAYPVITTLVVVGTANHYLLDAVAGALVVRSASGWPGGGAAGRTGRTATFRRSAAACRPRVRLSPAPARRRSPVSGRTVESSS